MGPPHFLIGRVLLSQDRDRDFQRTVVGESASRLTRLTGFQDLCWGPSNSQGLPRYARRRQQRGGGLRISDCLLTRVNGHTVVIANRARNFAVHGDSQGGERPVMLAYSRIP